MGDRRVRETQQLRAVRHGPVGMTIQARNPDTDQCEIQC